MLVEKLPRVTDVEAVDLDGDGDLDLVVSAFGLYSRGALLLYENRTTDWKEPQLVETVLDPRAGALETAVADLDHDGRPDLVALFAQQHEEVVAFLNRGERRFERQTVFRARTPAWGATGMQLVDLDGDGDTDVLTTNGETLDDATVRPYHGIAWLENRGAYPFVPHELAALPGAHRAVAADLDGDGDQDVAVAAFLPDPERTRTAMTSLGWLEQTRPGVFVRHAIEAGQLSHAALDVADVDGDGRPTSSLATSSASRSRGRTPASAPTDGWTCGGALGGRGRRRLRQQLRQRLADAPEEPVLALARDPGDRRLLALRVGRPAEAGVDDRELQVVCRWSGAAFATASSSGRASSVRPRAT
ncbi:MAG: VCBS repeat-containing protein [Vicinamibacteria bacterium]